MDMRKFVYNILASWRQHEQRSHEYFIRSGGFSLRQIERQWMEYTFNNLQQNSKKVYDNMSSSAAASALQQSSGKGKIIGRIISRNLQVSSSAARKKKFIQKKV